MGKICNCCKKMKPFAEFYPRTDRGIGSYKSECKECIRKKREKTRRTQGIKSYKENKQCSMYLGIHIAENLLFNFFENVIQMPMGNKGFDFVCGKGYKVDVKASTRHNRNSRIAEGWQFEIGRNKIADYFLCLAFDNRESLNPEHVWLIPSSFINNLRFATVSETTLRRWSEWEQPIDKVVVCCNEIKRQKGIAY